MNPDKIIKHLIQLENKLDKGVEQIRQELGDFENKTNNRFDEVLVIVQRLDQERHFTQRWIQRLEQDLSSQNEEIIRQSKEIKKIKKVLKVV